MKTLVISSILIVILLASNSVWAENLPASSSVQVDVISSYSYKAADGTTVVLGEIKNNMDSPINAVTVGVSFMNDNSQNIEYKTGSTLLQVITPGGTAPFSISSTNADPSITQIQVKLAGFRSAADKPLSLTISPGPLQISDKLVMSGTITNNGAQNSANTKLYLISYDAFGRVVAIGTSDPINADTTKSTSFSIMSDTSSRAKSYIIVAESDNYQSKPTPVNSIESSLPVVIGKTLITGNNGTISTIPVNTNVKITSNVQYLVNSTQSFVYYVQVKQFGGKTEFIGQSSGVFLGLGAQDMSVNWTPKVADSYFIETYVWSGDGIALASSNPSINVILVK